MMKMTKILLALAVAVLLASCGAGGDGSGGGGDDPNVTSPQTGSTDLSGKVLFSSGEAPKDFSIWLLNHTSSTLFAITPNDAGEFSIALEAFTEGSTHSLHLLDSDLREIGAVDFSESNSGLQSAFTYATGLGTDIGTLTVTLTAQETVDISNTTLYGTLGGGFSLQADVTATISFFPAPAGFESSLLGSELLVFEPSVLLNSFYNASSNTSLYYRDLVRLSRIKSTIETTEENYLQKVTVSTAGPWLSSTRLASSDSSLPETSTSWFSTSYGLSATSSTAWGCSVFTGSLPATSNLMLLEATLTDQSTVTIPESLDVVFSMPPKISAVTINSTTTTIDYTSSTDENGLTIPLTYIASDVSLVLEPPKDLDSNAVRGTTLPIIDVVFEYYQTEGGIDTLLGVSAGSYPSGYDTTASQTSAPNDWQSTWTPSTQTLRFELGTTAAAASTNTIIIPEELFLATSSSVNKVRIKIFYRHATNPLQTGIVAWFAI